MRKMRIKVLNNKYIIAYHVKGSIPDVVTGIFQWLNPSGRIVASNINEYQESFLGVKTAGA